MNAKQTMNGPEWADTIISYGIAGRKKEYLAYENVALNLTDTMSICLDMVFSKKTGDANIETQDGAKCLGYRINVQPIGEQGESADDVQSWVDSRVEMHYLCDLGKEYNESESYIKDEFVAREIYLGALDIAINGFNGED